MSGWRLRSVAASTIVTDQLTWKIVSTGDSKRTVGGSGCSGSQDEVFRVNADDGTLSEDVSAEKIEFGPQPPLIVSKTGAITNGRGPVGPEGS